jgi:hypothetical protein
MTEGEHSSGQGVSGEFMTELIHSIQNGESRSVIIACGERDTVLGVSFPEDSSEPDSQFDAEAVALTELLRTVRTVGARMFFGTLGVDTRGQLFVSSACNLNGDQVSEGRITQLFTSYLHPDNPPITPEPQPLG